MMRKTITAFLLLALGSLSIAASVSRIDEAFSVKEYNEFHEVLHPLQHEALPAKDFKRIRSNAAELVKRGQAIVRIGVPRAVGEKGVEGFRSELRKFESAVNKFSYHSQRGSDQELEASFSAVHDSFEMLAAMLPRK